MHWAVSKKLIKIYFILFFILSLFFIDYLVLHMIHAKEFTEVPLSNYSISWIGNSFPGKGPNGQGKWVQDFIDEIEVVNGTVLAAAEWDEAGRCVGLYRDGDVNDNVVKADLDGWGWGTANAAIAANTSYFYILTNANNLIRYSWDPANINTWSRAAYVSTSGAKAIALTEKENTLYSLREDGTLEVWNGLNLQKQKSFIISGAKDLVIDNSNNMWVIVGNEVKKYDINGNFLSTTISGLGKPIAVSLDRQNGYLIICDDGPKQQVLFYNVSVATPQLVKSFGIEGGIGAGTPGKYEPLKFFALKGAGTDSNGNIYVALSHGESVIRKFDSNGVLIWEVSSFHFVDCAAFLPGSDGNEIYGVEEIYQVDYSKTDGQEAKIVALTRDQVKYPGDPRLKPDRPVACNVWIKVLEGKKVMFLNGMTLGNSQGTSGLDIYVFEESPSMVAKFVGSFSEGGWAWDIDDNGNIWVGASSSGKIVEYKFLGFDSNGTPIYDKNSSQNRIYDPPSGFTKIERLLYDELNDVMYISGYTPDRPQITWGLIGRVLRRYDNWKAGNRNPRYEIVLPSEYDAGVGFEIHPKAVDEAGDYLFVAMCRSGHVHVYRKNDGVYVGTMKLVSQDNQEWISGWVDIPYGVRAVKRLNGEYVVLVEEDWRAKNTVG